MPNNIIDRGNMVKAELNLCFCGVFIPAINN